MKTRIEVATFWRGRKDEKHFIPVKNDGDDPWHWGTCEIRELLDFIYGGPPQSPDEKI